MTKVVALGVIVSGQLSDPNNDSFSLTADIYPALEEADKAILNYRPDANSLTQVIAMVAGSLQSIPATSLRLINVRCVMNTNGTTEERTVTPLPEALTLMPNWRLLPQVPTIEHFIFDEMVPTEFEVYPPSDAAKKLRIVTSEEFGDYGTIGAGTDSFLPQSYDPAKIEFALYRCYGRDNSPNRSRAADHFKAFLTLLGIKTGRDAAASPNSRGS